MHYSLLEILAVLTAQLPNICEKRKWISIEYLLPVIVIEYSSGSLKQNNLLKINTNKLNVHNLTVYLFH